MKEILESLRSDLFQSLSGFQVRCNFKVIECCRCYFMFQSLSGFQVRCNIMSALFEAAPGIGFNPYRVFKFVATVLILMTSSDTSIGFNPYRVFKFVATLLGTVLCI